MTPTITINSKDYAVAELSEAAKAQIANIQVADAEMARLQQQLALVQTARNAYAATLIAAVEAPTQPPAPTKKPAAKKAATKKA